MRKILNFFNLICTVFKNFQLICSKLIFTPSVFWRMGLQTLYRQPRTFAYFSRYADCHSYQPPGRTAYALDHAICQLCHPIYKLIGESADRNVTIFVRTNYNSLKEAWQSWQKFGNRAHSGDCNPLIIIA